MLLNTLMVCISTFPWWDYNSVLQGGDNTDRPQQGL